MEGKKKRRDKIKQLKEREDGIKWKVRCEQDLILQCDK